VLANRARQGRDPTRYAAALNPDHIYTIPRSGLVVKGAAKETAPNSKSFGARATAPSQESEAFFYLKDCCASGEHEVRAVKPRREYKTQVR